jgi:2-keto-3-deoxy-L-rhamnonate aldolase RhmA
VLRPNRLKRKLKAGEKGLGCWTFLAGDAIEALALCGFDALVVDHEHVAADLGELVRQMRCAAVSDTTVMVRLPELDAAYIKRVLDAGVEGVLAPTVETAEEARALVRACRYRPHGGVRGVGYPIARAAHWGLRELDYPQHYRENLLVGCIVETRRGMDNLAEILEVEGLELVCPGAGDLAADLVSDFAALGGAYGAYANNELTAMVEDAERRIRAAGKWLWGVGRTPAHAKTLLGRGYDFVTVTADTWLLIDGARAALAQVRE